GGDRGAAVLGPLGQVWNASSLGGAAVRARRGDGPARQLLHREDPAKGHPAQAVRRGGAEYRRPFAEPGEGRRPTLTWPRDIPIEGDPADVSAIVSTYADWLVTSSVPKLFLKAEPSGILAGGKVLDLARRFPAQTEVPVAGVHF